MCSPVHASLFNQIKKIVTFWRRHFRPPRQLWVLFWPRTAFFPHVSHACESCHSRWAKTSNLHPIPPLFLAKIRFLLCFTLPLTLLCWMLAWDSYFYSPPCRLTWWNNVQQVIVDIMTYKTQHRKQKQANNVQYFLCNSHNACSNKLRSILFYAHITYRYRYCLTDFFLPKKT